MKRVKVYSADWCGPCKFLKSEVLPLLKLDGWEVETIDVDDPANEEECKRVGVRGIPTSLVYDGDKLLETFVGGVTKAKFEGVFE